MLDVFQKAIEVGERVVEDRIEKGNGCRMETKRKIILALGYDLSEKDKIFPEI